MSYGQDIYENNRRVGNYIDKIFKGAKPAELPVEQPMRLELIVNRKTAAAIGLRLPQSFLLRANQIIE